MKHTNMWILVLSLMLIVTLSACEEKKQGTQATLTKNITQKPTDTTIRISVGKRVFKFHEKPNYNCFVYNHKVMSRAIKNEQIQFAVEQRTEDVWLIDYREKIEGKSTYSHYRGKEYEIEYDGKQIKGTAIMESHGRKNISLSFYIQCS